MSTFTPLTLTGTVNTWTGTDLYEEVDGTGMESQYVRFEVALSAISTQSHADGSTREANLYNGIDIKPGMFISDTSGNTIVEIKSISSKSETQLTCVVEDVDMLSYRLKSNNTVGGSSGVLIFSTNDEGEPLIMDGTSLVSGALDAIQGRFALNERDDRVKFSHATAPSVEVGDVVTVNTSGDLVKFGTTGGSDIKVGIVLEKLRGGKDIYIKPFNDIIRNYKDPEALSASPAGVYYTDEANAGEITTTSTDGSATFLHLNTALPTTVTQTSSTLPGTSDVVEINGVTVFNGASDSVADATAWSNLINTFTAQTNVTASITQAPGQLSSDDNTKAYGGAWSEHDVFIPIAIAGSTPTTYASITISDGNNSATITFDTPDVVGSFAGQDYDIMSPTAIKAEFDAAITANSLDITTALIDVVGNGQGIELTTTGSATGITLTSVANDAFGYPVVGPGSDTGLGTSATLGDAALTMTRISGGPIEIEGSPVSSGYINQGGVVTSYSGRVPFLMLIEGSDATSAQPQATGVNFSGDKNQTATPTVNDGDSTGATITHTPFSDGDVIVKVNGLEVNLGDGAKDEACYFSGDAGVTARTIAGIAAGDVLYWMGSIAGYQLDTSDDIDIVYQKSSLDS